MLLGSPQSSGTSEEKRLRKLFRSMKQHDQASLLRFAEFLAAEPGVTAEPMTIFPEPEKQPRPETESVVKAIKRLTAAYPMIGRDRLLNETSGLMTAHVIHGKAAAAVIDELEAMFDKHYNLLKAEFEQRLNLASHGDV